jgi:hypothetical protein
MTEAAETKVETNSVILPSDPAALKKIKDAMEEVTNSYVRIQSERDFIKEAIANLSEAVDIPKKFLSKLAKHYYKQDLDTATMELEDLNIAYENVLKKK